MAKLNQILAIEKGSKSRIENEITKIYHATAKPVLLSGIARSYQPKDVEGDVFPAESTKVQARASEMLTDTARVLSELFDLTLAKDVANCSARADVKIDGATLVPGVPVTHLLFLEKRLSDLHLTVAKIPVLDPSEDWIQDERQNCWATRPIQTVKTKKIPRNHVKAEATKEHPAQVELYHEDVVTGTWSTVKYSGAIDAKRQAVVLARIEALQAAVKVAREEANSIDAPDVSEGKKIFDYLFAT